ncbi:hypothetical protein [Aquimarina spongiae]|uniref:Four-helix bundle copper-binding protein n=1 Tax=Aquimarina spongiae TaxID=570521 RepID=A0A1M6GMI4_9FLAO|nr:hypothetical protein [Aquimarina spongiae]SHJ11145.1 hypothetical protein SAMN04488508_105353 [Aquimarina spongiae]
MKNNEKLIKELVSCAIEIRNFGFLCLKEQNIDRFKKCIEISVLTAEVCEFTAKVLNTSISKKETNHLLKQCEEQLLSCFDAYNHHQLDYCKECCAICKRTISALSESTQ